MSNDRPAILIVEDEPDTADLFAEMVRLTGHQVVQVNGYSPAIEHIKKEKPLAVILDIMMPVLSGMDVLRYIREDPGLKETPVMIVSALGLFSDIQTAMDAGANEYLTKPVSFHQLSAAIQKIAKSKDLG